MTGICKHSDYLTQAILAHVAILVQTITYEFLMWIGRCCLFSILLFSVAVVGWELSPFPSTYVSYNQRPQESVCAFLVCHYSVSLGFLFRFFLGGPTTGRLSHTCTCQRRGKHWDHSQGAGVSQQWSKGSYSMHSPALFAKRIALVKRSDGGQLPRCGQQYPDVKGLQHAPIRRPAMRLDMAVFAWEHMMHEQAAYH